MCPSTEQAVHYGSRTWRARLPVLHEILHIPLEHTTRHVRAKAQHMSYNQQLSKKTHILVIIHSVIFVWRELWTSVLMNNDRVLSN